MAVTPALHFPPAGQITDFLVLNNPFQGRRIKIYLSNFSELAEWK